MVSSAYVTLWASSPAADAARIPEVYLPQYRDLSPLALTSYVRYAPSSAAETCALWAPRSMSRFIAAACAGLATLTNASIANSATSTMRLHQPRVPALSECETVLCISKML